MCQSLASHTALYGQRLLSISSFAIAAIHYPTPLSQLLPDIAQYALIPPHYPSSAFNGLYYVPYPTPLSHPMFFNGAYLAPYSTPLSCPLSYPISYTFIVIVSYPLTTPTYTPNGHCPVSQEQRSALSFSLINTIIIVSYLTLIL